MIFSLRMRWHMPAARNIIRSTYRHAGACNVHAHGMRHMRSLQLAAQLARQQC